MQTKKPIVDFFAEHLSEYSFVPELRPCLIFRQSQLNGIFRSLAVQRDSNSNGLAIAIASTYDPVWQGGTAFRTGQDTLLPDLRLSARFLSDVQHWYFYKPTLDGLRKTLTAIHLEFKKLTPRFFRRAESALLSDRLLQVALKEARRTSPEERAGLENALEAVRGHIAKVDHPAFLQVRDALRDAWTAEVSKEARRGTSRLAYDCLMICANQYSTSRVEQELKQNF